MRHWKGDFSKPLVSICCITYNHKHFIEEALDSFLMQETNFAFEIVLDDDASLDNTQEIIKKYIDKFPHIISAKLSDTNIGASNNFRKNLERARGKYIALCEGDDYWIDSDKLQVQYDGLESNPSCIFSGHDVELRTEEGVFLRKHSQGRVNSNWSTGCYCPRDVVGSPMTVPHTSSLFFLRDAFNQNFFNTVKLFDYPLIVSLSDKGDFYFISDIKSVYRQNLSSLSYSRTHLEDKLIDEISNNHHVMMNYLKGKLTKEIKINLKGHYLMMYNVRLNHAIDKGAVIDTLKYIFMMIISQRASQYSLRDILWIVRERISNKFKGE